MWWWPRIWPGSGGGRGGPEIFPAVLYLFRRAAGARPGACPPATPGGRLDCHSRRSVRWDVGPGRHRHPGRALVGVACSGFLGRVRAAQWPAGFVLARIHADGATCRARRAFCGNFAPGNRRDLWRGSGGKLYFQAAPELRRFAFIADSGFDVLAPLRQTVAGHAVAHYSPESFSCSAALRSAFGMRLGVLSEMPPSRVFTGFACFLRQLRQNKDIFCCG